MFVVCHNCVYQRLDMDTFRLYGSVPHPLVKLSIVESLRDREVACSSSDRQGLHFESCVWRAVSSHSSNDPQEAQFSLYVHKSDLMSDSFHFYTAVFIRIRPSVNRRLCFKVYEVYAAMESQKAVNTYLKSEQSLRFVFELQYNWVYSDHLTAISGLYLRVYYITV